MNCSLCPFKFFYYLNYKVAYSTTYVVQYFYFANISAETKLLAKSFKPVDQGASVQLIDQGKKSCDTAFLNDMDTRMKRPV